MSIKQVKKIGFFAALAMLLGTVVGIGIFFKNGGIASATNHNGVSWLLAWIIGGLISLAAAISFSEMGSMKTGKVFSLAGWAEKVGGKKYGYFVKTNYALFYFSMLHAILGFFSSEALVLFVFILKDGSFGLGVAEMSLLFPIYAHVIIGFAISALFLGLNYISVKASGVMQSVSTLLKFVPLLIAVIVGVILPNTHNVKGGQNAFNIGHFKIQGLIIALPAVLFAYDAFLVVAQLSPKVEGGQKRTASIVLVGMITVIVLYTLIAISSILHNQGDIGSLIDDALPKSVAKAVDYAVFGFLIISVFGVVNGLSAANVAIYEQSVRSHLFVGTKKLSEKIGNKKTSLIYVATMQVFWTLLFAIPAIINKTDAYADGFSNAPVTLFFGIYAITILLYTLKRRKIKSDKLNNILYYIASAFAIASIFGVVLFVVIYGFGYEAIFPPMTEVKGKLVETNVSWGLFQGGKGVSHLAKGITFFSLLIIFLAIPLINWLLIKKIEGRDVIKDSATDFDLVEKETDEDSLVEE